MNRAPEVDGVVPSRPPLTWDGMIEAINAVQQHDDFLCPVEQPSPSAIRDPFADSSS